MTGDPIWHKTLTATDAQEQAGHPTGDVRLAQAGYEIDQTTYFRNEVFGAANWTATTNSGGKLVETADIDFDVTILGEHLGRHTLTVSHKPSGEAGQGNYTSNIRWGGLVKGRGLTGRVLRLYAPAAGTAGPFFLEVS